MNKILKKKYYRICFSLISPMNIGYGEGSKTDRDILRNSKGVPYVPASSLAGVLRDKMPDDEDRKKYLGEIVKAVENRQEDPSKTESLIQFYDANISNEKSGCQEKYYVSVRDSVALDGFKTAKDGAKFDMEVLEAGVKFVTYIEQNYLENDDMDYAGMIVEKFMSSGVSIGGKVTRGYGNVKVDSAEYREFDFRNTGDIDEWLEFELNSEKNWNQYLPAEKSQKERKLTIKLRQNGGLSIRKYTTAVRKDGDAAPDMEQLSSHNGNGDKMVPVIPGTTWAGAIRQRMKEFGADVSSGNLIFGCVGDVKKRSDIAFSESYINDSKDMIVSRNAIDRFTGGTAATALFTEKICVGGETELSITWLNKTSMQEKDADALAATLTDLHFGLLAIGGATSIGRGIFSIESIGDKTIGKELDGSAVYGLIIKEVKEAFVW